MNKIFLSVVVIAGIIAGTYLYIERPTVVEAPRGELSSEQAHLILTDLGIRIVRPDALTAIELRPTTVQSVGKTVRVASLSSNPAQSCELGVLYTVPKSGIAEARTKWTEKTLVAASKESNGVPPQVKIFSDFYLVFEPSQATCSNADDKKAIEATERGALWAAISSAEIVARNAQAEAYVRGSISELSHTEAVLGGTFYVTDVWAGDGVGVVSYEDGHISLTADFTYTVSGGAVTVETFVIRE